MRRKMLDFLAAGEMCLTDLAGGFRSALSVLSG